MLFHSGDHDCPGCPSGRKTKVSEGQGSCGVLQDHLPAHFQDAGKLAAEMGHTFPVVVFQRYRELVEPEEAARYWNIRHASAPANVVPMLMASA